MIFCLFGAFLENSLSKQNFPSPHMLVVCMQGEGESHSFFSQASCTVHGFAQTDYNLAWTVDRWYSLPSCFSYYKKLYTFQWSFFALLLRSISSFALFFEGIFVILGCFFPFHARGLKSDNKYKGLKTIYDFSWQAQVRNVQLWSTFRQGDHNAFSN